MNTLVITIGDATFNFIVATGMPISIQIKPIVEAPIVEAPIVESPIVEAPIVEEPIVEAPIVEEPIVEAPIVKRHKYQKDINGYYICPYGCGATKKNLNTMSEHVRATHSAEYGRDAKLHKCTECGDGFSTKTKLQHHVKNHHTINYVKCPHPGCAYDKAKNSSSIVQHYARHHMEHMTMYTMSDSMCICNGCGASSSKVGILYHLGICNKLSPFCKIIEPPCEKLHPDEKVVCECGCLVVNKNMARHCETKKHITLVNNK